MQIWNAVAGNNPFLSKQQFYTAMRLVSAAQVLQHSLHYMQIHQGHTATREMLRRNRVFMQSLYSLQRGGGKLSEAEARSILIGLGPALPPPTMAGLEGLKSAVPQILPEVQHPAPWLHSHVHRTETCESGGIWRVPDSNPAGGPPLHGYHAACYVQAQALPQASPQVGKQQSEGGAFPPMTGDDVQRYQGMFAKLDTDRDGYVMVRLQCK
jgi:hypothetical protein